MEYIVGIDIGTGSTKAVAVDLKGKTLAVHQVYYAIKSPESGWSEQDPEEIWRACQSCLKAMYDEIAHAPLAISFSSAMHSLILVGENNELHTQMITWADSRSADIALDIKESVDGKGLYERTGTPIHAMSPLCKIIWFKENQNFTFKHTFKFISIKEFIWHKLFGEYVVDHSIASSTGMFNIVDLKWDTRALLIAGIAADQLSDLVPTDYKQSGIKLQEEHLKMFSTTQFIIGASDGCLANVGSFATEPGIGALTIGTSGAVRIASRKPIVNYPAMTFNYVLDKDFFVCGGPVNNGGSVIQWLLKNVFQESELSEQVYDQLFAEINDVPAGSDGLIFLPYLSGERAPIWDSDSCGTFFGLRLQHGKPQFGRAVLEGVCFALNDVLQVVEESSEPIKQLNISGGFVQSDIWMQLLADITGKKLVLVQKEDASSIGAIFHAAKILKLDFSFPIGEARSILPNLSNYERYQKIIPIFKELYHALHPLMRKNSHLDL